MVCVNTAAAGFRICNVQVCDEQRGDRPDGPREGQGKDEVMLRVR